MESATARTTNHDNKLVYFGRKVIFLFKLYNYSNKKGRLRMKENKNTCTRKKTRKIIKQKNENNIYNVIVDIIS